MNARERRRILIGHDSTSVDASKPVGVIHYFNIVSDDPWTSADRCYSATSSLISNRLNIKRSRIPPLTTSSHGGTRLWLAISSLTDLNVINFDIGCEGADDHTILLNRGETFYVHDTISILPGSDTTSTFVYSEGKIQVLYSYRGWWDENIEAHWEMTDFTEDPMPFLGIELTPDSLFCLPDGNLSPNPMEVVATITNTGDAIAESSYIELMVPPECFSFVDDSSLHWLGNIHPEDTVNTSWLMFINPGCEGDSVCFNTYINFR